MTHSDQITDMLAAIHKRRVDGTVEYEDILEWIDRALKAEALAESRALALATMRAGILRYMTDDPSCAADCASLDPYPAHGACDCGTQEFARAILAQPADTAAALAGAVLEAADRMAEMMALMLGEEDEPDGDGGDFLIRMARARSAYRRARSALRGHGAVEG